MRTLLLSLSLALAAPAGLAQAALAAGTSPVTPTATLKQKNNEVDRLLRLKVEVGSPAEKKQKDDIKAMAASLLDYSELTRRAMAEHWAQITPAQQNDLVATLRELIERNYVRQIRSNLDYQVAYKDEKQTGPDAAVTTIVKVKTKGKSTDAEVVYKLHKVGGTDGERWLVWDIVTDEVSLMRNYKSQFHRIITESGFDELLRKMKNKLKEKDADDKADKEKVGSAEKK